MSNPVICRLRLAVTGTLVDGKLEWQEEIWTEGVRRHMAPGADVRDYEAEMCRAGCDALEAYEQRVENDARARQKAEQP